MFFDDERSAKRSYAMFIDGEDDERSAKRKVTKAIKDEVWRRYVGIDKREGKCVVCKRAIYTDDFEAGHNKARAKGGTDNVSNLRPICTKCNRAMGTKSIDQWIEKLQGPAERPKKADTSSKMKQALEALTVKQLKNLAGKHHVKVQGRLEEDVWGDSHRTAPTKRQYISKLSGIVTNTELSSIPKEAPKKAKTKKRRSSDSFW